MLQERLANSTILSIENEITKNIDFEDAIEDFASKSPGKLSFKLSTYVILYDTYALMIRL
jgi:hypothetical protein